MVKWEYYDFTRWIDQGCDPEVGLSVLQLDFSFNHFILPSSNIGLFTRLLLFIGYYTPLDKIIPKMISFTNLQVVNLSENNLTTLPTEIGSLTNLK